MEIVKETDDKIVIRMEANDSLTNAIRRSVEEVPTLAVDEVEFFKNDSALYDEFIAHRIGLVPLKTDKKVNQKMQLSLKLKKHGPCVVYSGDLKGNAEVMYNDIPITLLEKDQDLELAADIKLGKGIEHTKYTPGFVYYRSLFEIKSKSSRVEEIIDRSKGLVKEKKGTGWILDLNDAEEDEIYGIDKDSIKETNEILFFVESFGQIKARDILHSTIFSLNENLDQIEKLIK